MGAVLVVGFAFAALIIQSIMHSRERKDLYDRIMSRDYADYTAINNKAADKKVAPGDNNTYYKRMKRAYRSIHGDTEGTD